MIYDIGIIIIGVALGDAAYDYFLKPLIERLREK